MRVSADRAGRVVVEVSDTGPGIPADILDRIFDPFFTTKPVGEGTGLGLWICQGIVTSLGGEIAAENAPGQGATFRVVLPSATTVEQRSAPPPRDEVAAPPAARRLRLLVVDDEIAIGRTLAIALSDEFQVTTATSGREALQLLAGDAPFDVVLCDLMMPDVSGMDVYERVAQGAARPRGALHLHHRRRVHRARARLRRARQAGGPREALRAGLPPGDARRARRYWHELTQLCAPHWRSALSAASEPCAKHFCAHAAPEPGPV